ncbi:MAG: CDGSH iron-sulfur domain-containing protein [Ghiorsea sp.]|nr:CDGSH iron-sulfur domain-containing protein [Ghiorsea sp.]
MSENKDEVVIAGHGPAKVSLKKGQDYYYCTCGRSKNQPFCDGSHQGTSFEPMQFTVEQDGIFQLCQCKHTKQAPFCDGAHLKLS